jgi:hypothetical protein
MEKKPIRSEIEMWTPIQWSDRDVKVIPSKMFLKEKKDAQGNVTKIKSRLVAGGHLQNKEDFQDLSSSPTLPYPSLLILSLLAAKFRHHVVLISMQTWRITS